MMINKNEATRTRNIIKAIDAETEAETKENRKALFAELKADGFKKIATKSETKRGGKMGRSAAHYGDTKKSITQFIKDGKIVEVRMTLPKYRSSTVSLWSV